jgi:hypothetical protein
VKVILIDYAEMHYHGFGGTEIPKCYRGKFVQIRNGPAEYLVFSPKEFTRFHADIVRHFCRERDISGIFNGENKKFEIHDPLWVVAGGGKFEMDRGEKILRLYDNSMAYGRFDRKGLKEKILGVAEMSDYKVRID